jgi:hypothetical protein
MIRTQIPKDPADKLKMFKFMLLKVDEAIASVPQVKQEITDCLAKSDNIETSIDLTKKQKLLRMQELALYDQKERLNKTIRDMEATNAV